MEPDFREGIDKGPPACVYVMIAATAGGETYFKIGHSIYVGDRIGGVQTGCPLPIKRILVLRTLCASRAQKLEKLLHKRFRAFRTAGEWFQFDMENPAHKAEFENGCDEIIRPYMGRWDWEPYDSKMKRLRPPKSEPKSPEAIKDDRLKQVVVKALAKLRVKRGLAPNFWEK